MRKRITRITNNVNVMNWYRLMIHRNAENNIVKCRQLSYQCIVVMFVKIETELLFFIQLNQTKLRSYLYVIYTQHTFNIHLHDGIGSVLHTFDKRKI